MSTSTTGPNSTMTQCTMLVVAIAWATVEQFLPNKAGLSLITHLKMMSIKHQGWIFGQCCVILENMIFLPKKRHFRSFCDFHSIGWIRSVIHLLRSHIFYNIPRHDACKVVLSNFMFMSPYMSTLSVDAVNKWNICFKFYCMTLYLLLYINLHQTKSITHLYYVLY